MAVANNLARAGVRVSLVDRSPYPGGQAVHYGCKAADSCVHCGVCLLRDAMSELREIPLTSCYFSSAPAALHRTNGGYLVDLETRPNPIDWHSCTECGICRDACPRGGIEQIPGWKYVVTGDCTECGDCVRSCPVGAIRLDRRTETTQVSAGGVVVAAGFHPFDPSANRKWGYGSSSRVMTVGQLERQFFGETYRPAGSQRIAFVLCVGSRDVREGLPHCSRVCCATALRMANRIAVEAPDAHIDVYYMDIQHFGRDFERFIQGLKGRVGFVRSNPLCVQADAEGKPVIRFESLPDLHCQERSYDLVVLANGMGPPQGAEELAEIFGLDLDAQGYLQSTEPDHGIFVAGACRRPMPIQESIEDASMISHKVLRHLAVRT